MNIKTLISLLLILLAIFLLPELAMAEEGSAPPDKESVLKKYFFAGGPTMWVLLAGFIATVALTLYLFVAVSGAKMVPKKLVDNINVTMANHDIQGAYNLANATPCAYSNCISSALLKVNFERDLANKASMVVSAEDTLDQEENKVNGLINYLNTISTLAPMVGLFGTVIGMIAAFNQLTSGKTDPSDLAGGIGTAMLTTAGGLLVGIPAMFFYFFFKNRLASITTEIQKQFSYAIDVLSGELQLEGSAQPAETTQEEANPGAS